MTDILLIADLRRHLDEIGHTHIGQDITASIDVIIALDSSLKEIREENDRLKGETERLESLHRSEIADMAERFRSVNLSAALDLMPDNSALVVRAERAEASCEAMAKALEKIARDGRGFQCVIEDHKDGTKAFYKAAYHYYLQQVGWRISAARAAIAEYRSTHTATN
jgi:hypothetical protein